LPIVDISEAAAADKNKKITFGELFASIPAGTAAAPSVAFEGYPGTGIYSSGANQVAISINGTSRIVVDASGNVNIDSNTFYVDAANNYVGIGNTSPASELDVKGEIRIYPASGNATVRFGSGGVEKGKIAIDSSSNLLIETAGSERARIDSSGRLGIGTSSPSQKLQIATGNVQIDSNYGFIWDNSTTGIYGNSSPSVLQFYTGNAERARIDSSGRLLVGTSSDSGGALLQVNDDRIRIGTAKTPASATATGTTGEIAWDANYIYVCTATNTWKRVAISTW